ncbi:hypothetical protein DAPPUDRAFT_220911 [Daphnia pulex]|uniref:Uncharacterized protein n=1 Tax=Daphnia pulex TaxID=6669 RepID=E9FW89_DAPPU|nr:hypothetical protein DAPPUDRAFT_220911 [Daphnia pulex]|eukprot:EFX88968.1 hypothetical protein DAPPUDRAFT_220911 [Daphnia pulex]
MEPGNNPQKNSGNGSKRRGTLASRNKVTGKKMLLLQKVVEDGVLLGCCVAAAGSISGGCIEQVVVGSGVTAPARNFPFESGRSAGTGGNHVGHHRRVQPLLLTAGRNVVVVVGAATESATVCSRPDSTCPASGAGSRRPDSCCTISVRQTPKERPRRWPGRCVADTSAAWPPVPVVVMTRVVVGSVFMADDFVVEVAALLRLPAAGQAVGFVENVVRRRRRRRLQILGQRSEAADVVVDLVDLVVLGRKLLLIRIQAFLPFRQLRRQRVMQAAAAAAAHRVIQQAGILVFVAAASAVTGDGLDEVGRAAPERGQEERDGHPPVLAVEAQVLAEMGVVDLDAIRQESVLVEAALRHPGELFGGLEALPVDGQLELERNGRRDDDDARAVWRRLALVDAQRHGHDHLLAETGQQSHLVAELLADFQAGRRAARHHPHGQRQPLVEQGPDPVDATDALLVVLLGHDAELCPHVQRQVDVVAPRVQAVQEALAGRDGGRRRRRQTTAAARHFAHQHEQLAGRQSPRALGDVDVLAVRRRLVRVGLCRLLVKDFEVLTDEAGVGELAGQLGHRLDAPDGPPVLVENFKVAVEGFGYGQFGSDVDRLVVVFEFEALDGQPETGAGRGHQGRRRQRRIGQGGSAQAQVGALDDADQLRQFARLDDVVQTGEWFVYRKRRRKERERDRERGKGEEKGKEQQQQQTAEMKKKKKVLIITTTTTTGYACVERETLSFNSQVRIDPDLV